MAGLRYTYAGLHRPKLMVLRALSLLPGRSGRWARNRRDWRIRWGEAPRTLAAFEARVAGLGPGSICIDLGANVGAFTERMANHAGHVHAFEPDPWSFARLAERCGHLPNVTLHNAAVGVGDGTVAMRRAPGFAENPEMFSEATAVAGTEAHPETAETFQARQIDFLSFLRSLPGRAAIVKMDIEGAEVALLERLLSAPELSRIEALYVETHELIMPALRERTLALRNVAARIVAPEINLYWP